MSYFITNKGKIFDLKQKVIFFPVEDFIKEIVEKDTCFICGALKTEKEFNDEHIIPVWILKRFNLFNENVTLPNGEQRKYSRYKISCCRDCNSELGSFYERPLSEILKPEYEDLKENFKEEDGKLIFKWMSLIFLKTHLKDKDVRFDLDLRNESIQNAEIYDWFYMHHIHCVARSYYTSAVIEDKVFGSLIIVPILEEDNSDNFDFVDSHAGRVISIRVGDYAIIAVLDDSGFCMTVYQNELETMKGLRLSFLQVRELIANLVSINMNIENRPNYSSGLDLDYKYKIFADCPNEFKLIDRKERIYTPGKFLRYYLENIQGLHFDVSDLEKIENDEMGFLFDKDYYIKNHLI
jgi:hypothetical protein